MHLTILIEGKAKENILIEYFNKVIQNHIKTYGESEWEGVHKQNKKKKTDTRKLKDYLENYALSTTF